MRAEALRSEAVGGFRGERRSLPPIKNIMPAFT
jgi:hypothetical protein